MSKSTSFLYQLARAANDIEKLSSGDPKRIARRAKSIVTRLKQSGFRIRNGNRFSSTFIAYS